MPFSVYGFPVSRMDARAGYITLEQSKIHVSNSALEVLKSDGQVATLPVATLSTLFIGPGCSISSEAVDLLASMGTGVVWVRSGSIRFMGHGRPVCTTSRTAMVHAAKWADKVEHLKVVRAMYALRFGEEWKEESSNLNVLRGKEGVRVKNSYTALSKEYKVKWKKRTSSVPHEECDQINKCLNTAHHIMDGVCHSIIEGMGYIPQLGFIHTDSVIAFTLDISDLYKTRIADPVAFRVCAERQGTEVDVEGAVRNELRGVLTRDRVYATIADDLKMLMGGPDEDFSTETNYWNP